MLKIAETPELTGHLIWALFNDPDLMDKSGQTWIGAELAREYDIEDDRRPSASVVPRPLRHPSDQAVPAGLKVISTQLTRRRK